MADDLETLKRKRTSVKGACTRIATFVLKNPKIDAKILAEIKDRREKLDEYWNKYDEIQTQIEDIDEANEGSDRIAFENNFYELSGRIRQIVEDNVRQVLPMPSTSHTVETNTTLPTVTNNNSHVKLPKLNLIIFSGNYQEWLPFAQLFEATIIKNKSLSDVERFQYLLSSLAGEAAETIQSFELTAENFKLAWEMLKENYNKLRAIVKSHMRAIRDIPPLKRENFTELKNLLNTTSKHLRALRSLKRPTDQWDDLLIDILGEKLDHLTLREWEGSLAGNEMPNMEQFTKFITHKCETLEAISQKEAITEYKAKPTIRHSARRSAATYVCTTNIKCIYCAGEHYIYACQKFLSLSTSQRINEIRTRKLCTNCLKSTSHKSYQCNSGVCKFCKGKHNTLLHANKVTAHSNVTGESQSGSTIDKSDSLTDTAVITHGSVLTSTNHVMLSTALIDIFDKNGTRKQCRVLLDSGSQANLITKEFISDLQMNIESRDISITGINQVVTSVNKTVTVDIKSQHNAFRVSVECIVIDQITGLIPAVSINRSQIEIPKNLRLADPQFFVPSKIDMLVGADLFWKILCIGQIKLSDQAPIMQKTHFGWILAGSVGGQMLQKTCVSNLCVERENKESERLLTRFWQIEEYDTTQSTYTSIEHECEKQFIDTVSRTETGRFMVELPTKNKVLHNLGDSKGIALKRLYSVEKRLAQDPETKLQYVNFMNEYLELGHMKLIDESKDKPGLCKFYLPHHHVIKNSSLTTKLRVVFDASCKGNRNVSLNDALLVGPVVQHDLISIVLKFRTFKYVFTADVEKMYRQILVSASQTPLQRILWRNERNQQVRTYELQTLTYGTAPASFLATRCLKYLADSCRETLPIGSIAVANDFYMDDLLTGANTIEDALAKRDQIIRILEAGKFNLAKWSANNQKILKGMALVNPSQVAVGLDKESTSRILGIQWDPDGDYFCFSVANNGFKGTISKRSMLSEIAQLFDPLGLIGPVLVTAKLLIQELWQLKLDWDSSVPLHVHYKWSKFREEVLSLTGIKIPRCMICYPQSDDTQFHGFADASQLAYGACCYIRSRDKGGGYKTVLVAAKARVAPMKAVSLPRLELCAALLLSQLCDKIMRILCIDDIKVFLWSDSSITLAWIRSQSRRWSTFVANRVGEIQRLTDISVWNHVSSQFNPVDVISRGATPNELINSRLWWNGPDWLTLRECEWPRSEEELHTDTIPEQRMILSTRVSSDPIFVDNLGQRYSSFAKLKRVIAYCFRFSFNCRHKLNKNVEPLTSTELRASETCICKLLQNVAFSEELRMLKQSGELSTSSKILSLSPFLGNDGLIRVGGRLRNSCIPYDARHPILLPKGHSITILVIRYEHIRNIHVGVQATICAVRRRFWPIAIRTTTRKIIRKCIVCFKAKPSQSEAIMGNLPSDRVRPSRPFTHCGIDFGGPFMIREGRRRNAKSTKAYIALFVCFATKAVHLELVPNLSSMAFIDAFKRFISRRGKVACVYTDNGTNFVGAARELKHWFVMFKEEQRDRKLNDFFVSYEIDWQFIPPHAPHVGGLWEAAIKSAKYHLKRIIGNASLNYDEMTTVLCQIEAVLNSRPITSLSNDPNDLQALTPGHFLIGDAMNSCAHPDLTDVKLNRLSRYQRLEQLKQHFWRRWSQEYLHQLQVKTKWLVNKGAQLEEGRLVLVKQPGLATQQWLLGRIVSIRRGSNNAVRSAEIKTENTIITRPLTKLALLPLET